MTAYIYGSISESNVRIPENDSYVNVDLYVQWNSGTWANDNPAGTIVVEGVTHNFTANFNVGMTSSGTQLIQSWGRQVAHNTDGSKIAYCSATFAGNGSGTTPWSDSKVLTTIPRGSVIGTIPAFNFEDSFSVPITKYSDSFTDNLTIKIGETAITTKNNYTNNTAINLTDDEILAAYNALGSNMSATVTFNLVTMSGATQIGTSSGTATGTSAGTAYIKVSGVWRRAVPHIKVSGTWKKAIMLRKISGVWKRGVV